MISIPRVVFCLILFSIPLLSQKMLEEEEESHQGERSISDRPFM